MRLVCASVGTIDTTAQEAVGIIATVQFNAARSDRPIAAREIALDEEHVAFFSERAVGEFAGVTHQRCECVVDGAMAERIASAIDER